MGLANTSLVMMAEMHATLARGRVASREAEGARDTEREREIEGERGRERRADERSTERRTNLSCLQSKLTFARIYTDKVVDKWLGY